MRNQNSNWDIKIKRIVIALFAIEQVVIIYIIATRKGLSIVDWFIDFF